MRTISDDVLQEIESSSIRPLFLVSCQFANETIYVWTGAGDITWNGNTYKGVGNLGSISTITETLDTQAQGISLTLSGIPTELLGDALDQVTTSGKAQIYLGFLSPFGSLIADPIPCFLGNMDQPEIDIGTETCTISIAVENRLSDLQRARGGRYTDQDQRARHPNDWGLQYVSVCSDIFISWGH